MARIHVAAWQAAYAGLLAPELLAGVDEAHGRARLEPVVQAEPPLLWVAEAEGVVVGFVRFGASREDDVPPLTGEVFAINVDPSTWRRGHGRALLGVALEELRAQGFAAATLWVLEGNERARSFYRDLGWRCDGATRVEAAESASPLAEVRYRIALRLG